MENVVLKEIGVHNVINFNQDLATKVQILVKGNNNIINIHPTAILKNLKIEVEANNCQLIIGASCKIVGQIRIASGDIQLISIGDSTTFQGVYLLTMEKNSKIEIGGHCMFSRNIEVRTSDAHSVIDINTGVRVNKPKNVYIGNHVWVAAKVFITKGAVIQDDCIVGANSFVSKKFDESHVIIAGSPAIIIKQGVTWNRSRKDLFTEDEFSVWKLGL